MSLLRTYFKHWPSRLFWLSNLLFWLVLNTVASDNTNRLRLEYGRVSDFLSVWWDYLPWWGNWAIMAPIVIAGVKTIEYYAHALWLRVLYNLLFAVVCMTSYFTLTLLEVNYISHFGHFNPSAFTKGLMQIAYSPLHMDFLVYLSVASLGLTMHYYEKARQHALHNQTLANQLLKVELQTLKAQLSPHFLFNTLNSISGLVRLDEKSKAVTALSELSQMFRKVLENQSKQFTTLEEELAFVQRYLAIQKMRFEDKLLIETSVQTQSLQAAIPFMLLHTLVENAVQHGSQLESDHNLLKLDITIEDGMLNIELINQVAKHDKQHGFGIGLENCRKRLQYLFKHNYLLESAQTQEGKHRTLLRLPLGGMDA